MTDKEANARKIVEDALEIYKEKSEAVHSRYTAELKALSDDLYAAYEKAANIAGVELELELELKKSPAEKMGVKFTGAHFRPV